MTHPDEVKGKINDCPFDKSIIIKDLGLKARGPIEDELYAINTFLVKNIRRGNTIIEIVERKMIEEQISDKGEEKKETVEVLNRFMGRKGLTKFFDL